MGAIDWYNLGESTRYILGAIYWYILACKLTLWDGAGIINRNVWEMGLAFAIKDALRSGDLYLPQSKQHVSFWNLMLSDSRWLELKEDYHSESNLPRKPEAKTVITHQFQENIIETRKMFKLDDFAAIQNGDLRLRRADKAQIPDSVTRLQRVIDASMPSIRIEQLLLEVDQLTQFSQHFTPIQGHRSRPKQFYKTLLSALISQATNLGVVAMSASVEGISVDMLRQVLHFYTREFVITRHGRDPFPHYLSSLAEPRRG